jgi:transcription initiation factor TFIIIB Brf1 subunit/transcription initiation factor TFIIB
MLTEAQSNKNFSHLLLEAIEETFLNLGENVEASICLHMQNTFKIKKSQIPNKITEFSNIMEQIFGIGAKHLEILLMRNLNAKNYVACKWPKYDKPLGKWILTDTKIARAANTIWLDKSVADKIASESVKIINSASKRKNSFLNSKNVKSLIGSLFYLLGLRYDAFKRQRELADKLGTSDVAIRTSYKQWLECFPELFEDIIEKTAE